MISMDSPRIQSSPAISPGNLFALLASIILFDLGFFLFLFSKLSLPVGLPLLVIGFLAITKSYPVIVRKYSARRTISFIGLVLMIIAGVIVPPLLIVSGNFLPLLIGLIGPTLFVLGARTYLSENRALIWLAFFAVTPVIAVILVFFKSLGIFLGE